jgi:uroporphyrinogen III methyltransferase / synthase
VADPPLRGRRIVLTRPREQAGLLADRLADLGATVTVVPLVAIEAPEDARPLEAAARELSSYDWVVLTSANAVVALERALAGAPFRGPKVAAVGPATAEAVRELGAEPAFVPAVHAAEEVAAGLGPLEGARVLLPQADIASPELAVELRTRGAVVDAVVAYRTVAVEPTSALQEELRCGADAIVVASGSAAHALAAVDAVLEDGATVVYIGPKTAAVARDVGLPAGPVADEATAEGMIQALVTHFGDSR